MRGGGIYVPLHLSPKGREKKQVAGWGGKTDGAGRSETCPYRGLPLDGGVIKPEIRNSKSETNNRLQIKKTLKNTKYEITIFKKGGGRPPHPFGRLRAGLRLSYE